MLNTCAVSSCRQHVSAKRSFTAFPACHFLDIDGGPYKASFRVLNAHQCFGFQTQPKGRGSVCCRVTTGQMPIMSTKVDSTFSASEGTLAGDILWLATIAFVFAIITGIVG
jgi:hypothetical protein